jgi:hypothetical protein
MTKTKPTSFKAAAARRRQAEALAAAPNFEPVMPFRDWARLKGLSLDTAKRLRAAGKIRVVRLSSSRIGVSASADAAYMASCETT